jgi:hypothetical protein
MYHRRPKLLRDQSYKGMIVLLEKMMHIEEIPDIA